MDKKDYLSFIQELAKILNKSDLSKIEFTEDNVSIKLKKSKNLEHYNYAAMPHHNQPMHSLPSQPAMAQPSGVSQSPSVVVEEDYKTAKGVVKSPMVGVIYVSSSPDAEAFISEGKQVKEGDTLFLIEAMKVYNPIKATRDGKVTKILVHNQQVVEFDEPLVIIE